MRKGASVERACDGAQVETERSVGFDVMSKEGKGPLSSLWRQHEAEGFKLAFITSRMFHFELGFKTRTYCRMLR